MSREALARRELRRLGVRQSLGTRVGPYAYLLTLLVLALGLIAMDKLVSWAEGIRYAASPLVTAGALLLAIRQWRHHRNEVSISGSLDRLDIVNRYFSDPDHHDVVRHYFGAEETTGWNAGIESWAEWSRRMYVFMELDNLQYGLEKYRLGYSSAYQALRVVDLFAARAQSRVFLAAAKSLVGESGGSYTPEVRGVVKSIQSGARFLGAV